MCIDVKTLAKRTDVYRRYKAAIIRAVDAAAATADCGVLPMVFNLVRAGLAGVVVFSIKRPSKARSRPFMPVSSDLP